MTDTVQKLRTIISEVTGLDESELDTNSQLMEDLGISRTELARIITVANEKLDTDVKLTSFLSELEEDQTLETLAHAFQEERIL